MKQIGVEEFEKNHRNAKVIFSNHDVDMETQVVLDIDGTYYLKGPYARYEAICYLELGKLNDEQLRNWVAEHERLNHMTLTKVVLC